MWLKSYFSFLKNHFQKKKKFIKYVLNLIKKRIGKFNDLSSINQSKILMSIESEINIYEEIDELQQQKRSFNLY